MGLHRSGRAFPIEISFSRIDVNGKPRFAGFIRDITVRKQIEDQLARLAQYDTLTGLPNRNLFNDRLAQAVAHAQREEWVSALLFIDLDRFKEINDTLGHAAGDEVLMLIGERLRSCVRQRDTVARLSGDEFTIIIEDLRSVEDASSVAQKVLALFEHPVRVQGHDVFVSGSIGIAMHPADGRESDTLLTHADTAMYQAKAEGGNSLKLYASAMSHATGERARASRLSRTAYASGFQDRDAVMIATSERCPPIRSVPIVRPPKPPLSKRDIRSRGAGTPGGSCFPIESAKPPA